jgi:multidrug efflux pump subunit AcrA (membrane-fusion protein)
VARKVVFQFAPGDAPKGELAAAMRSMFADFQNVEMKATLGGTLAHPKFDLSTSIDKILSDRLKALVGKRVAEIDRQIRAAVNAQVSAAQASAQSAVAAQQAKLDQALGEMDQRSTQVQQTLDQRAKQAEAELKKTTERASKEAQAGAKKALEGKTKDLKLPKR